MKILIDGRLYGLENAGLGRYLVNLVDELANLDKKNDYVLLLRKKYFKELSVPDNWEKVLADFRHYSFKEQFQIPKIIKKYGPDISHFPHFNVPLFFRGDFVVTIHDILMHRQKGRKATTLPLPIYYLKRIGYHTVFKKAVNGAKKIIVPTKHVKKELSEYYRLDRSKIEVTYEGIDPNIKVAEKSKVNKKYGLKQPYFIHVGSVYPHKNLERAIEALLLLNKQVDKKVHLALACARNVFTKKLENMVKSNKAEKYVKLLGFVPDKDLGALLKHSVAYLFPSLSEGFGLPGLEAMRAETLVLASDIPVFNEVFQDNVNYFNPFDFSSMAKEMKNALEMSKEKREKQISQNLDFIKRYSWATMAKQTLNIYENSSSLRQGK